MLFIIAAHAMLLIISPLFSPCPLSIFFDIFFDIFFADYCFLSFFSSSLPRAADAITPPALLPLPLPL